MEKSARHQVLNFQISFFPNQNTNSVKMYINFGKAE